MATYKIYNTIAGVEIKVSANHSARTFTIVKDGSKYRTVKLDKEEFNSCLHNSGNDWAQFLKSNDYYLLK